MASLLDFWRRVCLFLWEPPAVPQQDNQLLHLMVHMLDHQNTMLWRILEAASIEVDPRVRAGLDELQRHAAQLQATVDRVSSVPHVLSSKEPTVANPTVDQLIATITAADTVIDGATTFINSVPGLIADAVAKAIANGATAAELQPLTDLGATLTAKSAALSAALTANTPTPPAP